MPEMTGGQALVASLQAHGVDTIFALPGVQLDNLFDALYDAQDDIRIIHVRHEQTTAYMAFGYAEVSGKVGVCLVVPGPGLLNATGALSTAYARNAPVLCIAGQIQSDMIDRGIGLLHEIPDQLGMVRHVTKWAARIDRPEDAPGLVAEAFRQLRTGRVRPVELEMAPDIMGWKADVMLPEPNGVGSKPEIDADALDRAARLLGEAQYPVIVAGGGARWGGEGLRQLADTLQAPVIMTQNGRGALTDKHPLALTTLGGHRVWSKADVVLAVGTRLERQATDWGIEGLKIVQLNVDAEEVGRLYEPEVAIVGDAVEGLAQLAERVERYAQKRESRAEEVGAVRAEVAELLWERAQPQASIAEVIREELPEDGIFVGDITQMGAYGDIAFPVYSPETYVGAGYQGTLGYGYATALGAQVGQPERKVISVNGDGGFLYTQPELATAKQHNIPVVAVVFNDGAYGNVKAIQRVRYGGREIASTLQNPDFVKLADAFGIEGRRAETPEQLREALKDGFESNAPMLIDYPTPAMPMVRQLTRGKVRG
jgi:acetolactate synthase I/II/III large subunit